MIKPHSHKEIIKWIKKFKISKLKNGWFRIRIYNQCDICGFEELLLIVECENNPGWVYVE